ncbi:hypothetical protein HK097_011073 [Rhizophlyctis rosea]|uniref:DUF1524 domain-containing protein n=1 Tax=Rhizophlyctis rosea TaxID=64517 RepID=A0AAD5X037_9FUNG|nr:hypothetical protein HK097_011073 [Rhizophlyctis rosea]
MKEKDPFYFIGIIVLARNDLGRDEIVDGQCRLQTLLILLATIRDLLSETSQHQQAAEARVDLHNLIHKRLVSQIGNFNEILLTYIYEMRGVERLLKNDSGLLEIWPEGSARSYVRRLHSIAAEFVHRLQRLGLTETLNLTNYILGRCRLLVISAKDVHVAFRIFSTINMQGIGLTVADIIHANLHAANIRTDIIYFRTFAESHLETLVDLLQHLYRIDVARVGTEGEVPIGFIDSLEFDYDHPKSPLFSHYARASTNHAETSIFLSRLKDGRVFLENHVQNQLDIGKQPRPCEALRALSWLRGSPWDLWATIAVAIHLCFRVTGQEWEKIWKHLEQLCCFMLVSTAGKSRKDTTADIATVAYSILRKISQPPQLSATQIIVELSNSARHFVDSFRSRVEKSLYSPHRAFAVQYLLRRISLRKIPIGAYFSFETAEVEHVYPQRPRESSGWRMVDGAYKLRHHIGNLVLLNKLDNIEASNKSWKEKCRIYQKSKRGTITLFPITVEVVKKYKGKSEWTAEIILERTVDLLTRLHDIYELYVPTKAELLSTTLTNADEEGEDDMDIDEDTVTEIEKDRENLDKTARQLDQTDMTLRRPGISAREREKMKREKERLEADLKQETMGSLCEELVYYTTLKETQDRFPNFDMKWVDGRNRALCNRLLAAQKSNQPLPERLAQQLMECQLRRLFKMEASAPEILRVVQGNADNRSEVTYHSTQDALVELLQNEIASPLVKNQLSLYYDKLRRSSTPFSTIETNQKQFVKELFDLIPLESALGEG